MKPLLMSVTAVLALTAAAQAAPTAAQRAPDVAAFDQVKGGHGGGWGHGGGFRGNRGLHRGWSIGRGNPHRFRRHGWR